MAKAESQAGDVFSRANKAPLPWVPTNIRHALLQRVELLLNFEPVASCRHARVDRSEINLAHVGVGWNDVMREEIEHGRPVNAIGAWLVGGIPPMAHARLLVKLVIMVELLQALGHGACLAHGHV